MNRLTLSVALSSNERVAPLIDGTVAPEGVELCPTVGHPSEIFWRQLHFREFDISEMSLSSLLIAIDGGDRSWLALPVFPVRKFSHTLILVRRDSGIQAPGDLVGRRIGVAEYQQTAALWTRGALLHEFSVRPEDIVWYMERTPDRSHRAATRWQPPAGVTINQVPPGTNIGEMMATGELEATLMYLNEPNLVDRSRIDLRGHPEVRPLFADPVEEERRYYRRSRILPANHCVVVRRELVDRHPWVALNLFTAFEQARELSWRRAVRTIEPGVRTGADWPIDLGRQPADPCGYGVTGNADMLAALVRYSTEQGLTTRRIELDEVFAPATMPS